MCGIAGIFDKNQEDLNTDIKQMTGVLVHRGPDGEGFWNHRKDGIWFGHRRLSIIDLSDNGKQPMHYKDGRYTITFNGEIYNYVELRKELTDLGYTFKSESDTEVLLAMYDYKGTNCLDYLDGMFAFAIWDSTKKKLFCARDRFGEKPFYYYYNSTKFYFASEMKAFWKIGLPKELKVNRVSSYLQTGHLYDTKDTSGTFYENIYQLPNGCYLEINTNAFYPDIKHYYQLTKKTKNTLISFEEAKEEFFTRFKSSVEKRLRSDVPVGTGLSGGMDSSSIVAMINILNKGQVAQNTFSARFNGFEKDEGDFIQAVLNQYPNINHHNVWPTAEDFEEIVDKMVYYQEEPFSSTSVYAQCKVMETVSKSNVKVLLEGQGSDEYLAGYLYYYARRLYYLFNSNYTFYKTERDHYFNLRKTNIAYENIENYKTKLFGWAKRRLHYKPNNLVDLDELLIKDSFYGSLQELLRYGDRNSMAHSVEVRLPFLDHKLVEFAFSLPDEYKLFQGWTKYILRSSMQSYLPPKITRRIEKVAFETPQAKLTNNMNIDPKLNEFLKDNHIIISHHNKWENFIMSKFI